jgi:hypothetical protein
LAVVEDAFSIEDLRFLGEAGRQIKLVGYK